MNKYQKILMRFSILIIGLIASGFLMQYKVSNMLNTSLEETMAHQTANISFTVEERFSRELTQLRFASKYISAHPEAETERNILKTLYSLETNVKIGLIRLDGQAVQGEALSKNDFLRLPLAFRGNEIVDYCAEKGLLFAVPVMNGDNVRLIIYKLYTDKTLTDLFGLKE